MIIHSTPMHVPFRSPDIFPDHQNSTLHLSTKATIQCDQRYGEDLDIFDCQNAISQFNDGTDLLAVADRRAIVTGDQDTLPLPFRVMGSKLCGILPWLWTAYVHQDSAHCFVQPVLMPGASLGKVSLNQVKAASSAILGRCAFSPSLGGIAKHLGIPIPFIIICI